MAAHFSLWLMPPAGPRERFAALIQTLSARLGTPRFDPHVTLCSIPGAIAEQDVVARTSALAGQLAPVTIRLSEVAYTEEYFRSLYICADRTPELLNAHRRACRHFAGTPESDYMPHLSLVYGDLPADDKERIIGEIGRRFDSTFTADTLCLCLPDGPPQGWRLLGPFPLTGSRPAATP